MKWLGSQAVLEGLIILRALKKVNFVGPCRIVANNDPFSVSLLTQTHSHSPPGVFNKDGIVEGKKKYCVCVCNHKHADSYVFMCMPINRLNTCVHTNHKHFQVYTMMRIPKTVFVTLHLYYYLSLSKTALNVICWGWWGEKKSVNSKHGGFSVVQVIVDWRWFWELKVFRLKRWSVFKPLIDRLVTCCNAHLNRGILLSGLGVYCTHCMLHWLSVRHVVLNPLGITHAVAVLRISHQSHLRAKTVNRWKVESNVSVEQNHVLNMHVCILPGLEASREKVFLLAF